MGTVYIYALINPADGKIFYVGKSNNPKKRYRQHISAAIQRGKSKKEAFLKELIIIGNYPLLRILEEVDIDQWKEREIYYIKTYTGLVNDAPGGGSYPVWTGKTHTQETKNKMSVASKGRKFSKEAREKMSEAAKKRGNNFPSRTGKSPHNKKRVYKYSLEGNYICEYPSATQAANETGSDQATITRCCNGKIHRVQSFQYSYTKQEAIPPYKYVHDIPVYQYDLEWNFLAEYGSVKEASETTGATRSGISLSARRVSVQKTAGGYNWSYSPHITVTADVT